ncbi:MAG: alpha/beta hydrolase [Saprospiraceae bacterium]
MKIVKIAGFSLFGLFFAYFAGPRPDFAPLDAAPSAVVYPIATVDSLLRYRESLVPGIRPHNEARIIWYDSLMPTEWSVVYLHGFSASPMEASPVHERFAAQYGCNLLLARLPGHGLAGIDGFRDIQPQAWLDAAKDAVAMGKAIGRKVIIMATSTGATLALALAAEDPDIAALLLYSPNVDMYASETKLLNGPWGESIAKAVLGGEYHHWEAKEAAKPYWSDTYHVDGLHALRFLVSQTMVPATFSKVRQPVFISYYYKNEDEQDKVISVEAIQDMIPALSTPDDQRRVVVNTTSTDHVIPSGLVNENWRDAEKDTHDFAGKVLGMVRKGG